MSLANGMRASSTVAGKPHVLGTRRLGAILGAALIGTLLGTLSGPAEAAVYKWTDKQGTVHYDDQNMARGQPVTRESVESRKIRAAPDWVGVVPVDFARDVARQCTQSRERVQNYRGASRLYRRDSKGEVQGLSAAQAQQMIAEAQRDAARYCAPDATRVLYRQHQKTAAGRQTAGLR